MLFILSKLSFDELNIIYLNIVNNLDTVIKGDTRTLKKKSVAELLEKLGTAMVKLKTITGLMHKNII